MKVEVSTEEAQAISHALHMHANFMETGDACLSAVDVEQQNVRNPKPKKIRALSREGMRQVLSLRDLADKFMHLAFRRDPS